MFTIHQNAAPKGEENITKAGGNMPALINPITGTTIGVPYNQQNIGQTIRPSATALLTIDSEDRFQTYTQKRSIMDSRGYNWNPYDFQIVKNEALMNGFFTRVGVSEVVFPTSPFPNISATTNTIQVAWSPAPFSASYVSTILLSSGFYNPAALASTVQSLVRTVDTSLAAFTMVYGVQNRCQFQYATNNTTQVGFQPRPYNSFAPIPNTTGYIPYPYPATTKQLFDLLGMTVRNNTLTAATQTTSITDCVGTRYYDICSSQLTLNQSVKDSSSQQIVRDSLCRVYIAQPTPQSTVEPSDPTYTPVGTAPTTIYRNFTMPKQIQWIPNQSIPGNVVIQVYDEDGSLVVPGIAPEAVNWSLTLLASEN